jgi:hypothetical protein
MFPIKKFVKGPNLHEESVARTYSERTALPAKVLTGVEAKEAYEQIVLNVEQSEESVVCQRRQSNRSVLPPTVPVPKPSTSTEVLKPASKPKPQKLTLNKLMSLCESNKHQELVDYLEEYCQEVNLDEKDLHGWTLLMSAACAGAHDCLKLLLQAGADWTVEDRKGLTAYAHAKSKGRHVACSIIDEWIDICSNPMMYLQSIQENSTTSGEETSGQSEQPVHCEACGMDFSNQQEHLKSIVHLLSSGEMNTDGKIHFGIPESNKGFQMMLRTGWNKSCGLGPEGKGQKFPIKTVLKRDRVGVGNEKDRKAARITHFAPFDPAAVENPTRLENTNTLRKRDEQHKKSKERRKEIRLRREFSQL